MNEADLCWRGPDWLPTPENWPQDIVPESSAESAAEAETVREVFAVAVNEANEIDKVLEKFPLQKTLRVCAWMRRFAHNCLRSRGTQHIMEPHHVERADIHKRARHLLKCKEALWDRWTREYLRGLRERHRAKTGAAGATPAIGDAVIIKSQERNRGKWPLGAIEELIKGTDGVVRAAKLRTGRSQLERAIQHLYPLEISCDEAAPAPAQLNPEAAAFRPRRDAAAAAALRIRGMAEDVQ